MLWPPSLASEGVLQRDYAREIRHPPVQTDQGSDSRLQGRLLGGRGQLLRRRSLR